MPKKASIDKPIGKVTHFYDGIGVAIVKFIKSIKVGEMVCFRGSTTNFEQVIVSMQYDHEDIKTAKKGQEVGIKVDGKVREGDGVFEV